MEVYVVFSDDCNEGDCGCILEGDCGCILEGDCGCILERVDSVFFSEDNAVKRAAKLFRGRVQEYKLEDGDDFCRQSGS